MDINPTGVASTIKTFFGRTTSVAIAINAPRDTIWKLLVSAADYPVWNSTVTSIEGTIAEGNTVKLKSTLSPKQTFKLKIKRVDAPNQLIWGNFLGDRTYALTDAPAGGTIFSMVEKISSPLFPLFASKIPSFDQNFEQFVADLKKAAESNESLR